MDEEDLAELKESQKLVDSTEPNNILGGTAGENLENEWVSRVNPTTRVLLTYFIVL